MISPEHIYQAYKNTPINPDAFRDWSEYRRIVTDFIISNTEAGSSVTVYGAGRCDDIDVVRLLNHFSEIVLADIDDEAMANASEDERINKVCLDFTRMNEEQRINYVELACSVLLSLSENSASDEPVRMEDYCAAKNRILHKIEELYEETLVREQENILHKTDCSIVLGVHSQLNNFFSGMWVHLLKTISEKTDKHLDNMFKSWSMEVLEEITELQKKYTVDIVRRLNSTVLENTLHTIVMGYELSSYEKPDSYVEGAIQGAQDIVRLTEEGKIYMKKHVEAEWPLIPGQKVIYRMMIGSFEVQS